MKHFFLLGLLLGAPIGLAADPWVSPQEVRLKADELISATQFFEQRCREIRSPSSFTQFLALVDRLESKTKDLKWAVSSGYESSKRRYVSLIVQFNQAETDFESYAQHPNFWVRYSWEKINSAYLELQWAFTQGN